MNWLNEHKIKGSLLILLYFSMIILFTYRLDDVQITLKGDISDVTNRIEIDNTSIDNQFYSIYVITMDRPTIFQYLMASLQKQNTIESSNLGYEDYTEFDYFKMGQISERLSYQYAIITAYEKASLLDDTISIDKTLDGYIISYIDKKQSQLMLGDIIVGVNDLSIASSSKEQILSAFNQFDSVIVTINRDNTILEFTINRLENGLFGLKLEPTYSITTYPNHTLRFDQDFIGGPSGGLIQTLDIYTKLLNIDLSRISITGTGTIDVDGSVGPIGGLKQKMYTIGSKRINLFFVPNDQLDEAINIQNEIGIGYFNLIGVSTFDDVITALEPYIYE